jgi:hypothetical protein
MITINNWPKLNEYNVHLTYHCDTYELLFIYAPTSYNISLVCNKYKIQYKLQYDRHDTFTVSVMLDGNSSKITHVVETESLGSPNTIAKRTHSHYIRVTDINKVEDFLKIVFKVVGGIMKELMNLHSSDCDIHIEYVGLDINP